MLTGACCHGRTRTLSDLWPQIVLSQVLQSPVMLLDQAHLVVQSLTQFSVNKPFPRLDRTLQLTGVLAFELTDSGFD